MKVNASKNHLLLSSNSRTTATIDNGYIESKDEQVLPGIAIDSNFTFENLINSICKKASQKFNVPSVLRCSSSVLSMFRVPVFLVLQYAERDE